MPHKPLLLLLTALAGCSKGPEADLQYISDARSIAAEWAMANEQASEGKLTGQYIRTMREDAREQLQVAASSLSEPHSAYGDEIRALLEQPADAPPKELRAHSAKLKQIEDSLESD